MKMDCWKDTNNYGDNEDIALCHKLPVWIGNQMNYPVPQMRIKSVLDLSANGCTHKKCLGSLKLKSKNSEENFPSALSELISVPTALHKKSLHWWE